MTTVTHHVRTVPMILDAATAGELMSANPVSIRAQATVKEATAMLTDRGFSAAPVIDEAGHPVGVISRADILVHHREGPTHVRTPDESHLPEGFEIEEADPTLVADIMTPAVFSVPIDAPVDLVISQMITLHVHQMFVVDHDGLLVGVISAMDVLRKLRRQH
jgi:CBS-domain-containing membrane protein